MLSLIDCTLRDGGYYNNWNFSRELIEDYLNAMQNVNVDFVELGFRSLKNEGFKGGCAFTTDTFIRGLSIPENLRIGVMVNASELIDPLADLQSVLQQLFKPAAESPVSLVRIACHIHEFEQALPACQWLKKQGYIVGFNLMQVADRAVEEISALAKVASNYPLDVLYFADSMGSLTPAHTQSIISAFQSGWTGNLGIHTHDNMGQALANSIAAVEAGVTWVDSTVTGMGRGPGNAKTEYLLLALETYRNQPFNIIPLLVTIRKHFHPLQNQYGWGSNPYYYLAGKHGIHPTYIQEMLNDSRYDEEDLLAVIEHLREEGGKKFSLNTLDAARHFYQGHPVGQWSPVELIQDKDILLLGTGSGVAEHREALQAYILQYKPLVMVLNTQTIIDTDLIDLRVACHPVRLLADCEAHTKLPHPLITPASMIPNDVKKVLKGKKLYDFGLTVVANTFEFNSTHCILPCSLVIAYALAIATSGKANRILMAGFDGYGADDPRNKEMNQLLSLYQQQPSAVSLLAITPSRYEIATASVYGLIQ